MNKPWNIKALAMGFLICVVLSLIATYAIAIVAVVVYSILLGDADAAAAVLFSSPAFYGILLVVDAACYVAGGITIARMAKAAAVKHAAVISAICFSIGAVLVFFSPPENNVQAVTNYISFALTLVPMGAAYWKSKQN